MPLKNKERYTLRGIPVGVVTNMLDSDIVVSSNLGWAITSTYGLVIFGKVWTLLPTQLFLYKDGFGIK